MTGNVKVFGTMSPANRIYKAFKRVLYCADLLYYIILRYTPFRECFGLHASYLGVKSI